MSDSSFHPFRSLYADDPLMQPLIVDFVVRLADQVADIRRAVAANDPAALQRTCHQLKGSGKSFGFEPISALAAAAEEKLRASLPMTACYPDINALLDYIEHIENYRQA